MIFSKFNKLNTNEKLLLLIIIVGIHLFTTMIFKGAKESLENITTSSSTPASSTTTSSSSTTSPAATTCQAVASPTTTITPGSTTSCPSECVKPTKLLDTCPKTLYRNKDDAKKCYKRCPYECPSTLDKCKTSNYCESCGTVTFDAPCDGSEIVEVPAPNAATSTALSSQIKSKTLDDNLFKVKDLKTKNKYDVEIIDGNINVYMFNDVKPPSQSLFTDCNVPYSPFVNQFTQT